jgi:hypothetical protein
MPLNYAELLSLGLPLANNGANLHERPFTPIELHNAVPTMKGFFVILITAFALGWLSGQARSARARRLDGKWLFIPVRGVRAVYVALFALALGLVFLAYRGPRGDLLMTISVAFLFVLLAAVTWPKAIQTSGDCLRQRGWWGGWKTIRWSNVSRSEESGTAA